jgi:hypothetical protein
VDCCRICRIYILYNCSPTDPEAESISVKIWNENMAVDAEIGSGEVSISEADVGSGKKFWISMDSGGKLEIAIQGDIHHNPPPSYMGVKVLRATGIQNIGGVFGTMSPFLRATLLERRSKARLEKSTAATKEVEDGGTSPDWGGEVIEIQLPKEADARADTVLLEVMNPGLIISEIGKVEVDLYEDDEDSDERKWVGGERTLTLDSGGELVCAFVPLLPRKKVTRKRGGSSDQVEEGYEMFNDPFAAVVVEISKAKELTNVLSFGTMDPYVLATLLPGNRTQRSGTIAGGGTEPVWMDGGSDRNERNESTLVARPDKKTRELQLQIFTASSFTDDLVGAVSVPVPAEGFPLGRGSSKKEWLDLDTGGQLQVRIFHEVLLTEDNCKLGARCHAGPHWTFKSRSVTGCSNGAGEDASNGNGTPSAPALVNGTIESFRRSDGEKEGEYKSRGPPLCAMVRWDGSDEACEEQLYHIGAVNKELLSGGGVSIYDLAVTHIDVGKEEVLRKAKEAQAAEEESAKALRVQAEEAAEAREKAEEELRRAKVVEEKEESLRQLAKLEQDAQELAEKELALLKSRAQEAKAKEEEERLERERKEKIKRTHAATEIQRACRVWSAKQTVRRLRAAIHLQRIGRGRLAKQKLAVLRLRLVAALRLQVRVRVWIAQRKLAAKKERRRQWKLSVKTFMRQRRSLAGTLQRIYRGYRVRNLCRSRRQGCVCIKVKKGDGIADVGMFSAQDPYAKVSLCVRPWAMQLVEKEIATLNRARGGAEDVEKLDFERVERFSKGTMKRRRSGGKGTGKGKGDDSAELLVLQSERTETVTSGGTDPVFEKKHNNTLVLPLCAKCSSWCGASDVIERVPSGALMLLVELWDQGVVSDTIIGAAEVDIPFVPYRKPGARRRSMMSLATAANCSDTVPVLIPSVLIPYACLSVYLY